MNALENKFNEIKQKIRQEVTSEDVHKITPQPLSPQNDLEDPSPVQYSDELRYLNLHWGNWNSSANFTSHRGYIGSVIVFFKKKFQNFLFNSILKDYFENEKNFTSNLVRLCNDTSKYIDQRDRKLFWDLINKIDSERTTTDARNDSLYTVLLEEIQKLNRQLAAVKSDSSNKISALESRIQKLETGNSTNNT